MPHSGASKTCFAPSRAFYGFRCNDAVVLCCRRRFVAILQMAGRSLLGLGLPSSRAGHTGDVYVVLFSAFPLCPPAELGSRGIPVRRAAGVLARTAKFSRERSPWLLCKIVRTFCKNLYLHHWQLEFLCKLCLYVSGGHVRNAFKKQKNCSYSSLWLWRFFRFHCPDLRQQRQRFCRSCGAVRYFAVFHLQLAPACPLCHDSRTAVSCR